MELYRELFPDRPCPSFQSLHRFGKGIGEEELWGLFGRLRERLQPLLPQEEALLLMDSTGLAHRSKGQRLRWRRGSQLWQVRGHSRLFCLVGYDRRGRLLALEGVAVGPAYASDVRGAAGSGRCKGPRPSACRLRGVVEGVFGAVKTRLWGGYLLEVLPQMARKRAYLEAVAYNLRLLLRLFLHLLGPSPLSPAPARCRS